MLAKLTWVTLNTLKRTIDFFNKILSKSIPLKFIKFEACMQIEFGKRIDNQPEIAVHLIKVPLTSSHDFPASGFLVA